MKASSNVTCMWIYTALWRLSSCGLMVQGNRSVVNLNTSPLISFFLSLALLLTNPFISFLENLFLITLYTQSWSGKVGRRQRKARGVKFRETSRQKDLNPTIFPVRVDVAGIHCGGWAVCFGHRLNKMFTSAVDGVILKGAGKDGIIYKSCRLWMSFVPPEPQNIDQRILDKEDRGWEGWIGSGTLHWSNRG